MKQIITKQKQTTAIKPVCVVYLYTDEETQGLDTAPKKVTEELIKERELKVLLYTKLESFLKKM